MSEGKTATLLERIGGEPALEAAVDEFYKRLVADNTLKQFFEGISIENLKEHQRKFLRLAFTKIPESIDVEQFMLEKHQRLFCMGLNEKHFDSVATHFVETLQHLSVPQNLIDEAVGIVGPLRPIFEQGAAKAKIIEEEEKKEDEAEEKYLLTRIGGDAALTAAVDEFYTRLIKDETLAPFFEGVDMEVLKDHQRKFLRLAFTKIPESIDVGKLLLDKHQRLFGMGLNATHFDSVAVHLVGTLQHLGVAQELIDEAVGIVGPLRGVFEQGAAEAEKSREEEKAKNEEYLLTRIGGDAALTAAVDEFYARLIKDETLAPFFEGVDMEVLKVHQKKFMQMAFTSIPSDVDVEKEMFKKHFRLFEKGLNETHFDSVAKHFVETLQHLGVAQELIDEAVGIIAPLRDVFVKGGKSGTRRLSLRQKLSKVFSRSGRELR